MGAISRFDLGSVVNQFGINSYIETGVGMGVSLSHAAHFFDHLRGCEGSKDVFLRFSARIVNEGLRNSVRQMRADAFLAALPDDAASANFRPLLFLDAHRVNGAEMALTPTPRLNSAADFSLGQELTVLLGKSWVGEAMIVIDAARLYQDMECFGGQAPEDSRPPLAVRREVARLLEQFSNTHRLDVLPHDDAYLVLLPWAWGVGAWDIALVRRGDRYARQSLQPGVTGATSISMMRRVHDARFATRYFAGHGIDIGGGRDALEKFRFAFPLARSIVNYDRPGWDAQTCANVADAEFDFLYSSHCLEHLDDPQLAFGHWLRVVRPGGWLVVDVPDEDLYEQGVFPSRFSTGHQHSFTVAKPASWSPRSICLLEFLLGFRDQCQVHSVQRLDHVAHPVLLNKGLDLTQTPYGEAGIEIIVRKATCTPAEAHLKPTSLAAL